MYKKLPMLQEGWDGDYHNTGSNKTPQDEIIRMAREAGFLVDNALFLESVSLFERFAALVAAHEREACAKVCEELDKHFDYTIAVRQCVAAIRARSQHA